MKSIVCTLLVGVFAFSASAQEVRITFSATGAATAVDSVTATNLMTDRSLTMPGDGTLVLANTSGLSGLTLTGNTLTVYPNPIPGQGIIRLTSVYAQTILLVISDLSGRVCAMTEFLAEPGSTEYRLTIKDPGIYLVSVSSNRGCCSQKIICTQASGFQTQLEPSGITPVFKSQVLVTESKNSNTDYLLGYKEGDKVHLRCWGGGYCRVLTDSVMKSKNYEVDFIPCTDPTGRNYSTVKIGNQVWMEENLAYLPRIDSYTQKSTTDPFYYVYRYQGTNLDEAKASAYYAKLGVLYNWEAARISCPPGWHLPSVQDYDKLVDYLYNNYFGYGGRGNLIAKSLASRTDWNQSSSFGSVGNQLILNNFSGFNALPAGVHISFGAYFMSRNSVASFWTSNPGSPMEAWQVTLQYDYNILYKGSTYSLRYDGLSVRCLKD